MKHLWAASYRISCRSQELDGAMYVVTDGGSMDELRAEILKVLEVAGPDITVESLDGTVYLGICPNA